MCAREGSMEAKIEDILIHLACKALTLSKVAYPIRELRTGNSEKNSINVLRDIFLPILVVGHALHHRPGDNRPQPV